MNNYWDGKNVLVTGGNGFIGSFAVEQLIACNANVISTASCLKSAYRYLSRGQDNLRVVIGNLQDQDFTRKIMKGVDVLLHLAAKVGGIKYNIKYYWQK